MHFMLGSNMVCGCSSHVESACRCACVCCVRYLLHDAFLQHGRWSRVGGGGGDISGTHFAFRRATLLLGRTFLFSLRDCWETH